MANDKIEAFKKEAEKFAEDFESKQKYSGTQTQLKDITSAFKANRNEFTIGDKVFNIKKFGIRDQISLVPILGETLFVPLSAILNQDGEMDMGKLTETAVLLFEQLGTGQFYKLLGIILGETTLNGVAVDIERDFEDLPEVMELCVKVFEVHYDVFSKSPALSKMLAWGQKFKSLQQ